MDSLYVSEWSTAGFESSGFFSERSCLHTDEINFLNVLTWIGFKPGNQWKIRVGLFQDQTHVSLIAYFLLTLPCQFMFGGHITCIHSSSRNSLLKRMILQRLIEYPWIANMFSSLTPGRLVRFRKILVCHTYAVEYTETR